MHKTHIPAIHPGLVLKDELEEIGVTQSQLATHIGVLPKTINEICRAKRGISAEMAWKLSQSLGASPGVWLNLQKNWNWPGEGPSAQKTRTKCRLIGS